MLHKIIFIKFLALCVVICVITGCDNTNRANTSSSTKLNNFILISMGKVSPFVYSMHRVDHKQSSQLILSIKNVGSKFVQLREIDQRSFSLTSSRKPITGFKPLHSHKNLNMMYHDQIKLVIDAGCILEDQIEFTYLPLEGHDEIKINNAPAPSLPPSVMPSMRKVTE